MKTYLSPREEQVVIDAVAVLHGSLAPDIEERPDLESALAKLPNLFADYRKLTNIAAIAHNVVVWFSGDRKRMFHKLGDLAEALCERDGVEPSESGESQLQREAVRIRREWGWHTNA